MLVNALRDALTSERGEQQRLQESFNRRLAAWSTGADVLSKAKLTARRDNAKGQAEGLGWALAQLTDISRWAS